MDASHLARSVNAAGKDDITNIMTVHDCYATLAPDTRMFAKIRRGQFGLMYLNNPLDRLFERNVGLGANDITPLRMGDLQPDAAIYSEYSDR
jgi:DNA-dependent RNA polymerase